MPDAGGLVNKKVTPNVPPTEMIEGPPSSPPDEGIFVSACGKHTANCVCFPAMISCVSYGISSFFATMGAKDRERLHTTRPLSNRISMERHGIF